MSALTARTRSHKLTDSVAAQYNEVTLSGDPFLLIVPVSLYHQMLGEIHRFFQWKLFDVYGYTGQYESRERFWREGWTLGSHRSHRKILLATSKVSKVRWLPERVTEGHEGHRVGRKRIVYEPGVRLAGGHPHP